MQSPQCTAQKNSIGKALPAMLVVVSCWIGIAAVSQAADRPSKTARPEGILYKVEKAGVTNFLFGTVHIGKRNFYPLPRHISAAIHNTDIVAVEVNILSPELPAQTRQFGYLPNDDLQEHLSPVDWNLLLRLSDTWGWPEARQMKPAILAISLAGLDARSIGLTFDYSVDSYLVGFAGATKKRVVELEGIERQMQMFDDLPLPEQSRFLSDTLKSIDSGENIKGTQRIVSAWSAGDESALIDAMDLDAPAADNAAAPIQERLYKRRNRYFLEALVKLSDEGAWFAGVGVGHLLGPTGLVTLLAEQGYKCTRIT